MRIILSLFILGSLVFPAVSIAQIDNGGFGNNDFFDPFVILSPMPDTTINNLEPLEISLLLEGVSELEIKAFLDNNDISGMAEITSDYLFYISDAPISIGIHNVSVIAISQSDTIYSKSWKFNIAKSEEYPPEESFKIPGEIYTKAGIMYSECSKDTTDLGLSYPIGYFPYGDANISGFVGGGFYNGFISYDPSYDKYVHGLFQYSNQRWNLSLGEFYPELSQLAFSGSSPLGGIAMYDLGGFKSQITACRTQMADTIYQTFTQYLVGGEVKKNIRDSLCFSAGYLYGYDQPGSLPDSIRFKTTTFIYNDTLTGYTDTLFSVDTLFSGKNQLYWSSVLIPLGERTELNAEYAKSWFLPDSSNIYIKDHSFLARIKIHNQQHSLKFEYTSWGQYFKSFGNPYLETAKNQLDIISESRLKPNLSLNIDGSIYKIFTDSTDGNCYKLGAGIIFSHNWLSSLYLRGDYNSRPYIGYLYKSNSATLNCNLKLNKTILTTIFSYTTSTSTCITTSSTAGAGLKQNIFTDKLLLSGDLQYYTIKDNQETTNQNKLTGALKLCWDISLKNSLEMDFRGISKDDKVDVSKSYQQSIITASVSHRF